MFNGLYNHLVQLIRFGNRIDTTLSKAVTFSEILENI